MNFLAHLFLSGSDEKIRVGNFIGDFVKGKNPEEQYGIPIGRGIRLHREIDSFTDRHPTVKRSKERLRPKYRHYSGVITDMFYDHFLARHWDNYSVEFLPDFVDECYSILQKHHALLPNDVQFMLPYMVKQNWLANYARIEGIHRALSGMAQRARFDSKMEQASEDLREYYEAFEEDFFIFFPELKKFTDDWLRQALV